MAVPKLIYFDMGNVLLHFDHELACQQMAAVAGVPIETVRQVVFAAGEGLQWKYERGEITTADYYQAFCDITGSSPPVDTLLHAASDIFRLNTPIVPIIRQLRSFGYRLGILSNTCPAHWEFICAKRFRLFPSYFDVLALSYELGAMKPDAAAYEAATRLAGVAPQEIFYVDDRRENVQGAIDAGYAAFVFTTAAELAVDLRAAGVRLAV